MVGAWWEDVHCKIGDKEYLEQSETYCTSSWYFICSKIETWSNQCNKGFKHYTPNNLCTVSYSHLFGQKHVLSVFANKVTQRVSRMVQTVFKMVVCNVDFFLDHLILHLELHYFSELRNVGGYCTRWMVQSQPLCVPHAADRDGVSDIIPKRDLIHHS